MYVCRSEGKPWFQFLPSTLSVAYHYVHQASRPTRSLCSSVATSHFVIGVLYSWANMSDFTYILELWTQFLTAVQQAPFPLPQPWNIEHTLTWVQFVFVLVLSLVALGVVVLYGVLQTAKCTLWVVRIQWQGLEPLPAYRELREQQLCLRHCPMFWKANPSLAYIIFSFVYMKNISSSPQ